MQDKIEMKYLLSSTLAIGLMLSACNPSTGQEQRQEATKEPTAQAGYRNTGTIPMSAVDPALLRALQEDREYVRSMAQPNVPFLLNYADSRQYRFAVNRLKLAGKTAETSPELFRVLEERRARHLRSGYGDGPLPVMKNDPGRTNMHFIEEIVIDDRARTMRVTATSTFPGGTYYTYTDVIVLDGGPNGPPLGDIAYAEEYDGGTNATVTTIANLALAQSNNQYIETYKFDDTSSGMDDSITYEIVDFGRGIIGGLTVEHPADLVNAQGNPGKDGIIHLCLHRRWSDCDYDMLGYWQVKMPVKGSVTLLSDYVFDQAKINEYKTTGMGGFMKIILTNIGGGCDVRGSELYPPNKLTPFWNSTVVSSDGKTLSWDMTGANSAFFDDGCMQYQNQLKFSMRANLPTKSTVNANIKNTAVLNLSNEDNATPHHRFPPMKMTNSCLAEGTLIATADGSAAPIESISSGARVQNPYNPASSSLEVTDIAEGYEQPPMVRIESENGKSLLLTEMHPIHVVSKGMIAAKHLQEGDTVMTIDGPSKLVKVAREKYDGKVYNLKVGTEEEMKSLGEDQTVMYANGFMVGDGQIQSKYESLLLTKDGSVLERLPARWHEDYKNSFGLR